MELLLSLLFLCIAGIALVSLMTLLVAVSECRERERLRYSAAGVGCFILTLVSGNLALYWLARAVVVAVR